MDSEAPESPESPLSEPSQVPEAPAAPEPGPTPVEVHRLDRPDPKLLVYYFLTSLSLGPFFFFLFIPYYFRYRTLRYQFDDEGVSMGWGILLRKEIHLTYARIQDIHLVSNVLERWLGLGRVEVQTASGSAKAEMTIEGLPQFEAVRDFLYRHMRGVREEGTRGAGELPAGAGSQGQVPVFGAGGEGELAAALRQVAAELRGVREALEGAPTGSSGSPTEPPGRPDGGLP